MREKLFDTIELEREDDLLSYLYGIGMIVVIILSLVPLAFKAVTGPLLVIEGIAAAVFVLDYLARWATADLKLKRGKASFALYPLTPLAIIDLLAILPTFTPLNHSLQVLKIFRLFRALRVLRVLKLARYSKSIQTLGIVIKKQKDSLMAVGLVAGLYILSSALFIFNVEPETFGNFFEALYWATESLTTIGYGDLYPTTVPGKVVTMISAFVGIAIIALPSSVITAGYVNELRKQHDDEDHEAKEES